MSQINPFTGAIIQSTQVQRTQAVEKDRQLRRAAEVRKNSGTGADRFEHAVESSSELLEVTDQQRQRDQKRNSRHQKPPTEDTAADDQSALDMTA